ncbi:hypothetical protein PDO_5200, partial [Rhizobium sp. PDO1-076]
MTVVLGVTLAQANVRATCVLPTLDISSATRIPHTPVILVPQANLGASIAITDHPRPLVCHQPLPTLQSSSPLRRGSSRKQQLRRYV